MIFEGIDVSCPAALPGPLALACHDAGAANLVIAWVQRDILVPIRPYMAGPALTLWREAFPNVPTFSSIDEALRGAGALLSGTGWATAIEHEARVVANLLKLPSFAVVDHWVNYPVRFERDGSTMMPDVIVVADDWAAAKARCCFGAIPITVWPNRYLDLQIARIPSCGAEGDILYVCEPARSNWGRDVAGEFQAIGFFIENLAKIDPAGAKPVRFRLHPSEEPEKYNAIINGLKYARLDKAQTLAQSISQSAIVVGMSSVAMVVALAAGRRVFSSLPPWAPACPLPHDGITLLREMGQS